MMSGGEHGRQSSLLSERSSVSADLSFCWTSSSRHSRQSSQFSEGGHSRQRSNLSNLSNLSDRSCQSFDNPAYDAYDASPRCRRGQQSLHSRHSRQSSAEMSSSLQPGYCSPFKVLAGYQPAADQGYHTMVGPQSSPDNSPPASLHLSSLSLSCPRGVTRPRPPAVPGSVQLEPSSLTAAFSSGSGWSLGSLGSLPDDLLLRILSQLDTRSLVRCGEVCRQLQVLAWHPSLWASLTLQGDRLDADAAVRSVLTRLTGRYTSVTRLNLAGCTRLSDAGLAVIARTCPALAWLDMRACKLVTNTGLAQLVGRCSLLQHLDISGCSLVSSLVSSSPGLQPHCRGQVRGEVRERLSHGLALTHLDLTDCTRLDDQSLRLILEASSNIEFLYVRRCSNLTDLAIKMVSAYCFVLRELSISDCENITDLSLLELARLGPKLRYLSAAKCHRLTDLGVTAVAKHCYKLRYLNIRGCEAVSDSSLQALAANCSKLRSLDIGKCDVTDAGLEVVARHIPALRKLSVRGCEMVSDRGVEAVAQHCHNLHLLNIQDCQVGLTTYRMVKKFCKRCIIEHTNPGFH